MKNSDRWSTAPKKVGDDAVTLVDNSICTLLESSPVCTKIIDLDSRLQYMSAAGQKQLKICDVEKYYGHQFPFDMYPDPWRASVTKSLERAKLGEVSNLECPVLDTDGNEVWYDTTFVPAHDEDGKMKCIVVTSVNITERKRIENALRASEARNRALLESSPVCTKIIDLDSRLQYMSAAGQNQLKICNIEEYYGRPFPSDMYPDPWRASVTEHLERAKSGEVSNLECPVMDTDGNEVWYDTTFVPVQDDDGSFKYIVVTSVNITERRLAELEARQHRDELAHVSRISTMGELATGMAHELNQPLAAIASYSCAAKMAAEAKPTPSEELSDILCKLEDQAIRAGEIVRHLRDFVTKTRSERAITNLNALVQEVAKFVEPDISRAGMQFFLSLDEVAPMVSVDRIQIQQVLVNLIRNSVDAMRAEPPTKKREVVVSTRCLQNGLVEAIVTDTGKSLTAEELEIAFNAFFTTKPEGMGMGLPISRSIIEAHGGKLWSRSNAEVGMTFGFTIPMEGREELDRSASVMIVDDDSAMRDSLEMVVRAMGFSARCFASAVEFLEFVRPREFSEPVCVIADIHMPTINGVELLELLNSMKKDLPVIMITGDASEAIRHKTEKLGSIGFLEKPFRPEQIKKLIKSGLGRGTQA